ncbi:MAG: S4 domain-containing protein YaaA [Bacilli bacterium]|jgi:S4 domain protein YaaA|nr:S4 domain-containing protein YaaA [Bacilli bacterium]
MKTIKINQDYITLQQLLKLESFISSGGQAKYFLIENDVYVNDELEKRRGRKLFIDDTININDNLFIIK